MKLKIRRPLCVAVLAWMAVLSWLIFTGLADPAKGQDELERLMDGQEAVFTGTVRHVTGIPPEETYYIDHICFGTDANAGKKENTDHAVSPDTYAGEIFLSVPDYYQVAVRSSEESAASSAGIMCNDRIRVRGTLSFPKPASNPGQFDDLGYCRSRGILFRVYDASVVREHEGRGIKRILHEIRNAFAQGYARVLPEQEAAILTGITLGDTSGISPDTRSLFSDGGIAHILAISALHVNLLALSLYRLLRRRSLPFFVCSLGSLAILGAYMIMTGMSLSSVRAAVMFMLWCLAQVTGRKRDVPVAAAAAAGIMTVWHPWALRSSSFWLSFGCVMSLYCLTGPLEDYVFGRKRRGKKRRNGQGERFLRPLISSLAVTLGTLPVCSFFFYQVTPWSFLVNPVILSCMGVLFVCGCLGSLLCHLWIPAGQFVLSACHYLLLAFMQVCSMERKLPSGVWITGRPAPWQIILYYIILAGFLGRNEAAAALKNGLRRIRCFFRPTSGRLHRHSFQQISCCFSIRFYGRYSKRLSGELFGNVTRRHGGRPTPAYTAGVILRTALLLTACLATVKFHVYPQWRMTCLDVGQGDSILIQMGDTSFLADSGSSSVDDVWSKRVSPTLKYYGISHLDGVFISHGDSDHTNGIASLIAAYERNLAGRNCADVSVDALFVSGAVCSRTEGSDTEASGLAIESDAGSPDPGKGSDAGLLELTGAAREKGILVLYLMPGDELSVRKKTLLVRHNAGWEPDAFLPGERGRIRCLYPSEADVRANGDDGNLNSMVLLVRTGKASIWLTGDLEKDGETQFISAYRQWQEQAAGDEAIVPGRKSGDGTVILKVGHHGSANATTAELLDLLKPDVAVISCGRNNRYGHPAQTVLFRLQEAGAKVYRTDRQGAVILPDRRPP